MLEKLKSISIWVLGVILLLAAYLVFFAAKPSTSDDNVLKETLNDAALAQHVSRTVSEALAGNDTALENLASLNERLQNYTPLQALPSSLQDRTSDYRNSWQVMKGSVSALNERIDSLARAQEIALTLDNSLPNLLLGIGDYAGMLPPRELSEVIVQVERFENAGIALAQNVTALTSGVNTKGVSDQRLSANLNTLNEVVRELSANQADTAGGPLRTKLAEIEGLQSQVGSLVLELSSISQVLDLAQREREKLESSSATIFSIIDPIAALDAEAPPTSSAMSYLPWLIAAGIVFWILSFFGRSEKGGQGHDQIVETNERNQTAILRLLDELSSLADGDLTVRATVTEDITGAIADSINYAIGALRDLVSTIDQAATELDTAAKQTTATAKHMAQASENQSSQVRAATESIAAMADSIENVSSNAERSARVAKRSVEVATTGNEAVRRTIDGMNTIRETIQDTSKRIKRLGESSQEIGNMVELINDIAEQTNILALNASIQASMAGEAGRGFAVVADEVQRLAERSANATKQIEVLVKTIQADTSEAVISMERSTTDVVSGALLAENAGSALNEIETVSTQIADLVDKISGAAREQAMAAADITRNTGVLQEISAQTADGTKATSSAISRLAEMATRLRQSVAGFMLPQDSAE